MLSTNIFYSGYNILFGILSLFLGISAVFLVRDSKYFRSLLLFQLGGLGLILLTYFTTRDHILYKIGLSYNFVAFVQLLNALLVSVLWINSSSELRLQRPTNREMLTVYVSLSLMVCMYYSFVNYNPEYTIHLRNAFTITGILLLLFSGIMHFLHNRHVGNLLFCISLVMLASKLVVSTFFYQYGWLNLNIFNWIWIYLFAIAVIFMRFDIYKDDLQKSWNTIDKLHLQTSHMIDAAPYPAMIVRNSDRKPLFFNHHALLLFGISRKELGYHTINDFFIDAANREQFLKLGEKETIRDFDVMVCNPASGTPFWMTAGIKQIEYNGADASYITLQDMLINKEQNRRLHNLADRDQLTSAWNRVYFEKVAKSRAENCIRSSQNFSFLLLDADNFKKINDKFGHKIGDRVLIKLAEICRNTVREDDIVARFGGEEFVIFLNDTDTTAALRVAERLRQIIEEDFIKNDEDEIIHFTVSIGVVSSERTSSIEVLLRQVTDAMYIAKHKGRNRVEAYDEELLKTLQKKRKKTANRNIHPVFQNEENEEISLLGNLENKNL